MVGRFVSFVIRVLSWVVFGAMLTAAAIRYTPLGVMRQDVIEPVANAVLILPYLSFALLLVLQIAAEGRRPAFTKDRVWGDAWTGIFSMLALTWYINLYDFGSPAFKRLETGPPFALLLIAFGMSIRIFALLWYRLMARLPKAE